MTTMTVSLPDTMRAFVEEQATQGGYATPGEYVASLVQEAQSKAERRRIEAKLIAGLDSGPAVVGRPRRRGRRDAHQKSSNYRTGEILFGERHNHFVELAIRKNWGAI